MSQIVIWNGGIVYASEFIRQRIEG